MPGSSLSQIIRLEVLSRLGFRYTWFRVLTSERMNFFYFSFLNEIYQQKNSFPYLALEWMGVK